jgi:signal transduction histidine kinase
MGSSRVREFSGSREELAMVVRHLIISQAHERERIARQLQESVGSPLAALKYRLEHGEASAQHWGLTNPQDLLRQAIVALQDALRDVHAIAMNVHPFSLNDLGVVSAVSWFCRNFAENHPSIEVHEAMVLRNSAIPQRLRAVVFRSVQDYLNGVASEPHPHCVELSLSQVAANLVLEIADADLSSEASAAVMRSPEQRLLILRTYAEVTGGDFSVVVGPSGAGTFARIQWALNAEEAIGS